MSLFGRTFHDAIPNKSPSIVQIALCTKSTNYIYFLLYVLWEDM